MAVGWLLMPSKVLLEAWNHPSVSANQNRFSRPVVLHVHWRDVCVAWQRSDQPKTTAKTKNLTVS